MIGLPSIVAALGVASVTTGVALLDGPPKISLRRSLLIGASIGLWLLLWYALVALAMSYSAFLSNAFGALRGPQHVTLASAAASWIITVVIARGLVVLTKPQARPSIIPGILLGLAWASLLLEPSIRPATSEAYAGMKELFALTTLLAILIVPVTRI